MCAYPLPLRGGVGVGYLTQRLFLPLAVRHKTRPYRAYRGRDVALRVSIADKNVLPEPTVDGRRESQLQSGSIKYQDLQSAKIVVCKCLR